MLPGKQGDRQMSVKKQAWPEGTPAWADLMAADLSAAQEFYAALFGWEYDEGGEEFGHYATARLGEDPVAGIGPSQGPDGPPPNWTVYLAADDAAVVADKAAGAGATVLMPPMEIGDFGAMAVLADPTGAVFGLWQSGSNTGVDRYNEPGAMVWAEVMVNDVPTGKDFYGQVFSFGYNDMSGDPEMPYWTMDLNGEQVGGIGDVSMMPAGTPSHWRVYFGVSDIAETCAKATELGGSVVDPPWETPFGTMATLTGPGGEVFVVNQAPPEA